MPLSLLCPTLPGGGGGWRFKGDFTSAACPLGGAFTVYGGFLLHVRMFVYSRLMKETAPVEGN